MESVTSNRRMCKCLRKGGTRYDDIRSHHGIQFTPTTYWIVANEFTRFVTWSKSRISEERRTAVITRAERKIRRRGIVPRIAPVEQADIKASIVQPSRQAGGQAVGQAGRQAGRQAGGI